MMVWVLAPFTALGILWVALAIHQLIRMARFARLVEARARDREARWANPS